MDVIVQVVADVIEKQYKMTTLYMIRTAIQLKEIQRSAHTICFYLSESKPQNIFLTLEAIVAKAIFKSNLN